MRLGYFAVGSETPGGAMPTSGAGTYSGIAIGRAVVDGADHAFSGIAKFAADFADGGSISGGITNITVYDPHGTILQAGTMNDITFADGTLSRNSFKGNASASPATGSAADITDAKGGFRGNFFGPGHESIGGTFNLSNDKSTVAGAFGAKLEK